jgi:hypothetical protein
MESRDRVKKIAKCAEESNDLSMMKIIESDGFIERQFLNHFLKNGIFACRHCLYKTALPNISHIYCLLK